MSSSVIYLVVGLRITEVNLEYEDSVGTLAANPRLTTTTTVTASRNTGAGTP